MKTRINRYMPVGVAAVALALAACGSKDEPETPQPAALDFQVTEYLPAPGQFVNEIPEYADGDDARTMAAKADRMLHNGYMVSLGAWGGSITLRLNRPLDNGDGPDFRIKGNAYFSATDAAGRHVGNSEPGIVYVMRDENKNGLPDDTWYELKGETYDESQPDYTVTYHRPEADADDRNYIRWTASDGSEGFINRVSAYHSQNFFAEWVGEGDQTFSGRRLPDNGYLEASSGLYRLINLKGYADSWPDSDDGSKLDISSAVDAAGKPVSLPSVDFIKVVTGVLQTNGNLGECSTEVSGIEFFQ